MKKYNQQDGITLLITLLLMGVLLGVSTALLNVTLRQYQLAGISYDSEVAFQAASAGIECALYWDFKDGAGNGVFEVPNVPDLNGSNVVIGFKKQSIRPSITCMGVTSSSEVRANTPYDFDVDTATDLAKSGQEQSFDFSWNGMCTQVSVYKFLEPVSFDVAPDPFADIANYVRTVGGREMGPPCPEGSTCTVVQARGYNVPCSEIGTALRVVEREFTQLY